MIGGIGVKILYRDHRSSLAEAMATVREYCTVDEMKAGIAETYNRLRREAGFSGDAFSAEDISVGDDLGEDNRIGWANTHYVCIRWLGDDDFVARIGVPQAIGFCSFVD